MHLVKTMAYAGEKPWHGLGNKLASHAPIEAMGSAMTHMVSNAVPAQAGNGRMAIGIGAQAGKAAVSLGYGKRLPGGASVTFGASFSGGENSAGAGFGFDL